MKKTNNTSEDKIIKKQNGATKKITLDGQGGKLKNIFSKITKTLTLLKSVKVTLAIILMAVVVNYGVNFLIDYVTEYAKTLRLRANRSDLFHVANEGKYHPIAILKTSVGRCTVFIISPKYALSAAHCIGTFDTIKAKFFKLSVKAKVIGVSGNIQSHPIPVKIIAFNHPKDVALIEGDFSNFTSLNVDFSGKNMPSYSENVNKVTYFVCGFAYGISYTCVSANYIGNVIFDMIFKINSGVYPGMSGGPLLKVYSEELILPNGFVITMPRITVVGITQATNGGIAVFGPTIGLQGIL